MDGRQMRLGAPPWVWAAFVAGAVLITAALVWVFGCSNPAFAAGGSANLSVGSAISYGGYETNWMSADGVQAYCAQPAKDTPATGTYAKSDLRSINDSWPTSYIACALYYGYGGPGFASAGKAMFPATWYDGTAMTDARYAAVTHIIVADMYTGDVAQSLAGTDATFRTWCLNNVLTWNGSTRNANATQAKMTGAVSGLPATFEASCFVLETGANTQDVLSYAAVGTINLQKGPVNYAADGYSLAGATFTVYADEACTNAVGTITTNAAGQGSLGNLAAGRYTLKETAAPVGFVVNGNTFNVVVPASGSGSLQVDDNMIHGGVKGLKVDRELEMALPLGSASLAGAKIAVVLESERPVYIGSTRFTQGQTVMTLTTAENGSFSTGASALPYGDYSLEEVTPPAGYRKQPFWNPKFSITEHRVVVDVSDYKLEEQVVRGDFKLVKVDAATGAPIANVAFRITSRTTGESHIQVTNASGLFNTGKTHSLNMNANDAAVSADGVVNDALLDARAGCWFCGRAGADVDCDDVLSALPYDTYVVEELPCAANAGATELARLSVTITEYGKVVDLGTVTNQFVKDEPTDNGETPGGGDTPSGGEDTPTGGNDSPHNGTEPPSGEDNTPTGGEDTPAGGNDTPQSGSDTTPGGGDPSGVDTPNNGTETPGGSTDEPGTNTELQEQPGNSANEPQSQPGTTEPANSEGATPPDAQPPKGDSNNVELEDLNLPAVNPQPGTTQPGAQQPAAQPSATQQTQTASKTPTFTSNGTTAQASTLDKTGDAVRGFVPVLAVCACMALGAGAYGAVHMHKRRVLKRRYLAL